MFVKAALGVISGSLLVFAGTQVWNTIEYKKFLDGLLYLIGQIRFEDLDLTDVDWDDLIQGLEELKKTLE